MVVARAHAIEDCGVELEAERSAGLFVHDHGSLDTAPTQLDLDLRLVGLDLVPDHVAQAFAVEREKLVADKDPGVSSW